MKLLFKHQVHSLSAVIHIFSSRTCIHIPMSYISSSHANHAIHSQCFFPAPIHRITSLFVVWHAAVRARSDPIHHTLASVKSSPLHVSRKPPSPQTTTAFSRLPLSGHRWGHKRKREKGNPINQHRHPPTSSSSSLLTCASPEHVSPSASATP
jgi:hypothetical protein